MKWSLILCLVFVLGCITGGRVISLADLNTVYPTHGRSKVDMVVLSESLSHGKDFWQAEIEREYPGAVGVLCHGGDVDGVWTLHPDHFALSDEDFSVFAPLIDPFTVIEDKTISVVVEVQELQRRYPGRLIVLCVCNPNHHRLKLRGVVYALDSVYVIPDRVDRKSEPDAVGNIYEFVHD